MKKIILIIIATCVFIHCGYSQVVVNGIEYGLSSDMTALIYKATAPVTGDYEIPSTVTYQGKTYKVKSIMSSAYNDCSQITSLKIPKGVIFIGRCAFENCTGLKKVSIPDGIKEIDYRAFYNCNKLQYVELPRSLEILGKEAFSMCSSLIYVSISSNLEYLYAKQFGSCTSLTDIFIYSSKVISMDIATFRDTPYDRIKLHVPSSQLSNYLAHNSWRKFMSIDSNMNKPQIRQISQDKRNQSTSQEAIDMGGSVEWASMNLGAASSTQQGDHYAWGEVRPKTSFTRQNYEGPSDHDKYSGHLNILFGAKYDAAKKSLGSPWRLPTSREMSELLNRCKAIVHYKDKYVEFIAPNGNRLFLPFHSDQDEQKYGATIYWTSNISNGSYNPWCLIFYNPDDFQIVTEDGSNPGFIRPVRDK